MKICFVIGCNGTGKTTLMDVVKKDFPAFGTVEVGRMMREKYPPSHFAGQSNPAHTATEAWQMLLDGMAKAFVEGKEIVFVDGQPRDIDQARNCLELWPDAQYLHLYASDEVRKNRCRGRDSEDPEKLKLSTARHESDSINNYKVLCLLLENRASIVTQEIDQKEGASFSTDEYRELISYVRTLSHQ